MKKLIILIVITFLLSKAYGQDKVKYGTYNDSNIGWSTKYPANWKVLSDKKMVKKSDAGVERVEETSGVKLAPKSTNLLCLKKNKNNNFISFIDFNDPNDPATNVDSTEIIRIIESIYQSSNMPYKIKASNTKIDGLTFFKINAFTLSPISGEVLRTQEAYLRILNDKSQLTLMLTYTKDEYKEDLYEILRSSKFSKRD